MIYISSAGIKATSIVESILVLFENGFSNIELSGGTEYYDLLEEDLLKIQRENGINFLLHNYFPPPVQDFVLNIASLNDNTFHNSISQLKKSIDLSVKIEAKKFGFHAGFYLDIMPDEIGKNISFSILNDEQKSFNRFYNAFQLLSDYARGKIQLYIENNVCSHSNYLIFKGSPFMFLNFEDYLQLKKEIDFHVLLDIGHLKVNCETLGLDFKDELNNFIQISDYIHISDNDGKYDTNQALKKNSDLYLHLKDQDLKDKTITLEIYEELPKIKESYNLIWELVS